MWTFYIIYKIDREDKRYISDNFLIAIRFRLKILSHIFIFIFNFINYINSCNNFLKKIIPFGMN